MFKKSASYLCCFDVHVAIHSFMYERYEDKGSFLEIMFYFLK